MSSDQPTTESIIGFVLAAVIIFAAGAIALAAGLNTEIILALQTISNPAIDGLFAAISNLGDALFYIVVIVIFYWVYNPKFARNLAYVLLIGNYLNTMLKDLYRDPRPPEHLHKVKADGYGVPSGHSQGAVTFYGYIGFVLKDRKWMFIICLILIVLIAVSRLYNGVHDLEDVTFGLLFGILTLLGFLLAEPIVTEKIELLSFKMKLALSFIIPIALLVLALLIFPKTTYDYGMITGALCGISVGYLMEQQYIKLEYHRPKLKLVLRVVIGLVVVLGAYVGLSLVLKDLAVLKFIRYTLIAMIATMLVPSIFKKWGL